MMTMAPATVLAALSLGLAASLLAGSEKESSSRGGFQVLVAGQPHKIDFEANTDKNGHARGHMLYRGPVEFPEQDVDGTGEGTPGVSQTEFSMTAAFDCMQIAGQRAVMSGKITGSTVRDLIGRRAVLTVEDNGDGSDSAPLDRVTWGVYEQTRQSWVPMDSENSEDFGAGLSWIATDAEREDDPGVSTRKSDEINCRTIAIGAYNLILVERGSGDIQVVPPGKKDAPAEVPVAAEPPLPAAQREQ